MGRPKHQGEAPHLLLSVEARREGCGACGRGLSRAGCALSLGLVGRDGVLSFACLGAVGMSQPEWSID